MTTDNCLCLDFFAGSSTTAHAVMQLNAEDGGNRRFIMVQLPEACGATSEAAKAGYGTIAEISKERIRRAGKKILEGDCHEGWNRDVGFRVLKVDTSNMADVFYTPDALQQNLLDLTTDNIKPSRTPEDLLFQVLLDWGVELTLPIRKESIQGKTVFLWTTMPWWPALIAASTKPWCGSWPPALPCALSSGITASSLMRSRSTWNRFSASCPRGRKSAACREERV